jgi:hypothetical protein
MINQHNKQRRAAAFLLLAGLQASPAEAVKYFSARARASPHIGCVMRTRATRSTTARLCRWCRRPWDTATSPSRVATCTRARASRAGCISIPGCFFDEDDLA